MVFMLNILVYEPDKDHAQWLRKSIINFFSVRRYEIQLTTYSSPDPVITRLTENPSQYSIIIISCINVVIACQMASIIRKENLLSCIIIFAADYKALPRMVSYRLSGFLISPIELNKLNNSLSRAIEEQKNDTQHFVISNKFEFTRFPFDKIEYFQSDQRYVIMYIKSIQEYRFIAKLDTVEEQLPKQMFLRCHQSYCVNFMHIESIDKRNKNITLTSGTIIPISKRNYTTVIDILEKSLT